MTLEALKRRRMANQFLLQPTDKLTAVRALCGVQAQFMKNAVHALKIRTSDGDEADFSDCLVKNWTLRGTMHIFAREDLPLFLHERADCPYRGEDFSGRTFWNQRDCWALTPHRQGALSRVILDALRERPRTRDELKAVCRSAGMTDAEEASLFDPWGGGVRELCERGFMHYAAREDKTFELTERFAPLPEETAQLELARRYFTAYAPATIHDAMYFFHVPARTVKHWLERLDADAFELDGRRYYFLTMNDAPGEWPRCRFLAGFDPLILGYEKKETPFLRPEHLRGIFNLAGIVMPAVLLDGTVAGRWRRTGRALNIEWFGGAPAGCRAAAREEAARLWDDLTAIKETDI